MRWKFYVGALMALALVVVSMTSMQNAQANTAPSVERHSVLQVTSGCPDAVQNVAQCKEVQWTNVATNETVVAEGSINSNAVAEAATVQDAINTKMKFIPSATIEMQNSYVNGGNCTNMAEPAGVIQLAIYDITRTSSTTTAINPDDLNITNQAIRGAPASTPATMYSTATTSLEPDIGALLAQTATLNNIENAMVPEVATSPADNDAGQAQQFAGNDVANARNQVLRI